MFRKLLFALLAVSALTLPAPAQDDPQLAKIAAMSVKELDAFVNSIALSVNQDTLKLRSYGQTNNCLELTRAANSLSLAYAYLAEVRDQGGKRTDKEVQLASIKALQLRVIAFAARLRAGDWLNQRCRNYAAPAEYAGDPRYQTPPKVSNAEYTEAMIEARQTAETNLAIAVGAGISGRCPDVVAAGQNITLLIPYLDKLLADTARKPEVLGPRASRRGLEVSRRQLLAARDKLYGEFGDKCRAPGPAPAPEADGESAPETPEPTN